MCVYRKEENLLQKRLISYDYVWVSEVGVENLTFKKARMNDGHAWLLSNIWKTWCKHET